MTRQANILTLRSIRRTFPDAGQTRALRGVDLDVHEGEFIAIVGRSGSGKSTLLNILGLLDTVSSGDYYIGDQPTAKLSAGERDRIRGREFGFVFQESYGMGSRTVGKNVEMPLIAHGSGMLERRERVETALGQVGLTSRANHLVRDLSGGERQRMAIARAIVHRPKVLLVDEPTGSLDSKTAETVHNLLVKLNETGTTVVVVTHDERLAQMAQRRITMSDGLLTADAIHRPAAQSNRAKARQYTRRSQVAGFLDRAAESVLAVAERKGKSLLSIAVIALGIAGLVAGIGVNQSASFQVSEIFDEAALDEVRIASRPGTPAITGENIAEVESLDGVFHAGLMYSIPSSEVHVSRIGPNLPENERASVPVLGITPGALFVFGIKNAKRYDQYFDSALLGRRVALLGRDIAKSLGVRAASPGVQVWIQGAPFSVAGIVSPDERHAVVGSSILISDIATTAFVSPDEDPTLIIKTEKGRAHAVSEAVPLTLDPANPSNFIPQSTADLAELRSSVDRSLSGLFVAIAIIMLLVAVLSTSSSLSASILYRRKEIGLWRALGFSKVRVATSFTGEGIVLGLFGGITGAGLGTVIFFSLALLQGWPARLDPSVDLSAIGIGMLTGALASVVPALRASGLQPAMALRN